MSRRSWEVKLPVYYSATRTGARTKYRQPRTTAAVAAVRPALGHELLAAEAQPAVAAAPGLDVDVCTVVEHRTNGTPAHSSGKTTPSSRPARSTKTS